MKTNLVLIGFMGSGKTYVGKHLARDLNKNFVDFDEIIQQETGMSILEIFQSKGELFFRLKERILSEKMGKVSNTVIATGGGIVLAQQNINNLSLNGILIYLECDFDLIIQRLKPVNSRPLFSSNSLIEFEEIFHSRTVLYENSADIIIDNTNKDIHAIVDEIKEKIKRYN